MQSRYLAPPTQADMHNWCVLTRCRIALRHTPASIGKLVRGAVNDNDGEAA